MNIKNTLLTTLVYLCFFHFATAFQILPSTKVDTVSVNVNNIDPLGRSNPKGTIKGLLDALANEDYLKATNYFDFSTYSSVKTDSALSETIKKIEIVLNNNSTILPVNLINDNANGNLNDGLTSNFEKVGDISLNSSETLPIYLEQITNAEDQKLWVISNSTTEVLLNYIEVNDEVYTEEISTDRSLATKWQGAPLRDWLIIVVLLLLAYPISWLITKGLKGLIRLLWKDLKKSNYERILNTLFIPLRLVLAVTIFVSVSRGLGVSIILRQSFSFITLISLWIALFIFIWLLINTISSLGEERFREREIFSALSAVSFLKNSAKFALIVVAILIIFDTLGFNVTAGIAALGFGGIALALGAQKTVENIVGGLSVVFDQPVSVGDFCKFGDTVGTVEQIGMRSTRVRTLGRTLVTIPNADFSSQLIENYAKRDMFLFLTTLGLRYETSSDQMRYILVELRKILYAHPKVDPDPARVRFLGYGSDSLKVEIFAYIHAADWNDYLGVQEDINLRIAEVIENSGSGFAFPSQTVYISQDQGLSETKKAEAEAKVKEWMDNNELQIPNFDSQTIESLKNTLTYPPNSEKS
jgi:MscS family membrane protein